MSGINFDQMKKYTYTLVMFLLWSATSVAQIKIGNHTFKDGSSYTCQITGRHDPIIVPRAVVVVEAMAALTVLDALMLNMTARLDSIVDFYNK